ncbi:hypothetical protein LJC64_00990 [Ruminococcaceae bacterium OttesenSCG-928-A11]|nr:hypothetical protein [Ruminococcaceae bacterium OttesenSCG-928-A11]
MSYKTAKDLTLKKVNSLKLPPPKSCPELPAAVYEGRLDRLVERMAAGGLDAVVIYADREHIHNFKYFAAFDPRFEEALLVIHRDRRIFAVLGNECLGLTVNAKLPMTGVLCQILCLPNQPMESFVSMEQTMADCKLEKGMRVGAIDWKLMTPASGAGYRHMSSMPAYIHSAIVAVCGSAELVTNETGLLIDPADGLRIRFGADEIAEFEYGATLASLAVIDMQENLKPGMTEKEVGNFIKGYGLPPSCHAMVRSGENTARGLISPTDREIKLGDEINLTYALPGGLTCRQMAVARDAADLPFAGETYLEEVVKPYLATVFNWYEMLRVGVCGGDIYEMVASTFPKEKHGWFLNPGHYGATEEWSCSPVYPGSTATVPSGALFQMDIIPSAGPAFFSPNDEDGVVVADEALRGELAQKHPEAYARIMARRAFMEKELGLTLHPDVLPLSNMAGKYTPFALDTELAVAVK